MTMAKRKVATKSDSDVSRRIQLLRELLPLIKDVILNILKIEHQNSTSGWGEEIRDEDRVKIGEEVGITINERNAPIEMGERIAFHLRLVAKDITPSERYHSIASCFCSLVVLET